VETIEKATLVKFGQYKHICQLRDEGLLYMNNLPYFRQIEDEELRGDKFDSVAEIRRGNSGVVTPKNEPEKPLVVTSWEIHWGPSQPEKINIFCMCAVRPSAVSFPINKSNFRFGTYALVLTNPQEFIDRISSRLRSQNISHKAGLVEYVGRSYVGKVGPFLKLKNFAYQSEWRLVCCNGPGKQRDDIRIGSIKDISIVVKNIEANDEIARVLGLQT